MNGFIKLSVLNIDAEDVKFRIEISNNRCTTTLDFYGNRDEFKNFGSQLSQFPKKTNDTVAFELGEDNRKWAYYMLINAFCYDASAHTALKILVDNLSDAFDGHRTEFTLLSEVASINLLGELLKDWDPRKTKEIVWESHVS